MMIIILLFIITILFVIISSIAKFGFNRNTLIIIFSKIWRLRGFFFIIYYLYTCIKLMNAVEDGSSKYLIPFVICGVALLLSMYRKTRKYGLSLFIITLCFGLFVIYPIIGFISSYNNGNLETKDLIGTFIFIASGLFIGINTLKTIKEEK